MYEIIFITLLGIAVVAESILCIYLRKKKKKAFHATYEALNLIVNCYDSVQAGIRRFNKIYDVQLSFYLDEDKRRYVFTIKDPKDGELSEDTETSTDCCENKDESTQN